MNSVFLSNPKLSTYSLRYLYKKFLGKIGNSPAFVIEKNPIEKIMENTGVNEEAASMFG